MTKVRLILISCMAMLGLFAANAVAAQAAPHWNVNGTALTGKENIEIVKSTPFTLEASILGHEHEKIECAGLSETGGYIEAPNLDGAESLTFSECFMPTAPACVVPDIETEPVSSELIEGSDGKLYDKFVPAAGPNEAFAWIEIQKCGLATELEVTGSAAGGDSAATIEQKEHTLVFSQETADNAGTSLKVDGQPGIFTGEATLQLEHGENWSAQH